MSQSGLPVMDLAGRKIRIFKMQAGPAKHAEKNPEVELLPRRPATRQHANAVVTPCGALVAGALVTLPLLAGCSLGVTDLPAIPHHVDDDPPLARTYRSNLASSLQKPGAIFARPDRAGPFEISEPRHTIHLTGRAWLICVKTEAFRKPVVYALFMKSNRVVDFRTAVWIDRCDEQTYEPLVMN